MPRGLAPLSGLPISAAPWRSSAAFLSSTTEKHIMGLWKAKAEATYAHTVDSWDTPFTALEGDTASFGLRLDVREPHTSFAWGTFLTDLKAAAASAVFGVFTDAAKSTDVVLDGRAPNIVEYWSAGAPNWYGCSQRGRVGLHWRGAMRPILGRTWFSAAGSPTIVLAFSGQGYLRVTKTIGGTTTTVLINGAAGVNLTEQDWLDRGYHFTEAFTLAPGELIDIYYVQDRESWGGLVAKVIEGTTATQAQAADAPVVGCGLFDTGTQPTKNLWQHVERINVQVDVGRASEAEITVPLVNPSRHDGFGWEWRQDTLDDPGYLVCWNGGVEQFQVKRGRLVRAKGGYSQEEEVLVTGIVQDIPAPRDGRATIRILGFEHRLIEARNRLEPDPVSYMTAGYRKITGYAEPVYGITAYDAWTIERAVADCAYRAGIDASRMRAKRFVRKADGTSVVVNFSGTSAAQGTWTTSGVVLLGTAAQCGDGDTASAAWHTNTAVAGAYIQTDIGAGLLVDRCSIWVAATGALATYKIRYSGDGTAWTDAVTAFTPTAVGINTVTFTSVSARYWRIELTNTPGAGPSYNEVQFNLQGADFLKFRARSAQGTALRLERPPHYGNVGTRFIEVMPIDDPYIFVPESRDDSWSRVLEIADRYGYDIRFDSYGDLLLSTRANACFVYDAYKTDSAQASTRKLHPSAYKGTYIEWAVAPTVKKRVKGARIDVSLPRGASLGTWATITVKRASDQAVVATISNVVPTATSDVFYYDFRLTVDGANATILTAYSGDFDTYDVELVGTGAVTRRIDGIFVYEVDPFKAAYSLSTVENAFDVVAQDAGDEMRNVVTVVGRRKATVTDSDKFQTNPNNPDPEFVVEVAVDSDSVANPTATNYVGMRKEAMIIDDRIADQDYAAYLARTMVYRYRVPRPPADITHTLIAELSLRACLTAVESTYRSVTDLANLWVTGYTQSIAADGEYTTTIRSSSWPEFPSYEPRDDIDIDVDFNGVPVTNVQVQYTSCTGHVKTNLASSGVIRESMNATDVIDIAGVTITGTPEYLVLTNPAWPPVPGSVAVRPSTTGGGTTPVVEEYPNGGSSGGFRLAGSNSTSQAKTIQFALLGGAKLPITSVHYYGWRKDVDDTAIPPAMALIKSQIQVLLDPTKYHYNQEENVLTIDFPSIPSWKPWDEVSFKITYDKFAFGASGTWRLNTPYHHFVNVDYRDSNRRVYLPYKQGDGAAVYQRPAVTAWDVRYRKMGVVDGTGTYVPSYGSGSPFYDVTTSELGYLINFKFDALVSGLYRVSVRSTYDQNTAVAYLTEPSADPQEPEAHWQYVTAGAGHSFNWDGVDQIGTWNREQSKEYAGLSQGWFEDESKQLIGAGWYVWNRENDGGAAGRLALISDDRNADGSPVYGQGTHACWYLHIECKNETLAAIREADASKNYPRVVKTIESTDTGATPIYTTAGTAAVVYTHMPTPAQLELEIADWIESYSYDPTIADHLNDTHWQAPWYNRSLALGGTFEGLLSNQKPTRVRFNLKQRPGTLWATQAGNAQIKLTRHAHMKAIIHDQFSIGEGSNFGGTAVEQRTVVSRRLHNDDHTITFVDEGWRKASTFKNSANLSGVTEWIFRPQDFKKDFGRGIEESVLFGNYLQLEDVPHWEQQRSVAGKHSRMLAGFMAYLFYLSAYCTDRTGRRVWGMNRLFIDRYKITANAYADWWDPANPTTAAVAPHPTGNGTGVPVAGAFKAELPYESVHQQRRTIVCRQWVDESGWRAAQDSKWFGGTANTTGYKLLRHLWKDHEPGSANLNGVAWPTLDEDRHSRWHRDTRSDLPATFDGNTRYRQLGEANTGDTTRLGTWTWETNPKFIPCVTRDFHPYFFVPPMPDAIDETTIGSTTGGAYWYAIGDITGFSGTPNTGRDVAASPTWYSWARDMTRGYTTGSPGTAKVRLFPGTRTTPGSTGPGGVEADSLDYVRQDQTVHYEDLRGLFSRDRRPSEGVRKITPAMPYYINQLGYDQVGVVPARNQQIERRFPKYSARVSEWFRLAYRTEYFWESGTFFPIDDLNRQQIHKANVWITRFIGTDAWNGGQQIMYDGGAWTGWKDDSATSFYQSNVFNTGWMIFDIAAKQGPTADMYMHLVLVNERRRTPVV